MPFWTTKSSAHVGTNGGIFCLIWKAKRTEVAVSGSNKMSIVASALAGGKIFVGLSGISLGCGGIDTFGTSACLTVRTQSIKQPFSSKLSQPKPHSTRSANMKNVSTIKWMTTSAGWMSPITLPFVIIGNQLRRKTQKRIRTGATDEKEERESGGRKACARTWDKISPRARP